MRKIGKIFHSWRLLRKFARDKRRQKKLAEFVFKRKTHLKIFAALRKIKGIKLIEKIKQEVSEEKDREFQHNVYKLNNEIAELQLKIKSLEKVVSQHNMTKADLQSKIHQAFIKGFSALSLETATALDFSAKEKCSPNEKNFNLTGAGNFLEENVKGIALNKNVSLLKEIGSSQKQFPKNETSIDKFQDVDILTNKIIELNTLSDLKSQNIGEKAFEQNFDFSQPNKSSKDHLWQPLSKEMQAKSSGAFIRPNSSKNTKIMASETFGISKTAKKRVN